MTLPATTLNGIRYFEAPGTSESDPTYLLLHGLGNSLDFWVAVVPELAGHGRVVAIDLPGFGQSARPPGKFGIDNVTDAVLRFLTEKQIGPCTVVAHSLGSFVATRLAAIAPAVVTKIVMVDGALVRANRVLRSFWRAVAQPSLSIAVGAQFALGIFRVRRPVVWLLTHSKLVRRMVLWPFVKRPADINVTWLAAALGHNGGIGVLLTLLRARAIDYPHLLSQVPVPLDVVWGDSDRLMDDRDVEITRSLARVQRSLKISDCGHWPLLERPSQLAQFILDGGPSVADPDVPAIDPDQPTETTTEPDGPAAGADPAQVGVRGQVAGDG